MEEDFAKKETEINGIKYFFYYFLRDPVILLIFLLKLNAFSVGFLVDLFMYLSQFRNAILYFTLLYFTLLYKQRKNMLKSELEYSTFNRLTLCYPPVKVSLLFL